MARMRAARAFLASVLMNSTGGTCSSATRVNSWCKRVTSARNYFIVGKRMPSVAMVERVRRRRSNLIRLGIGGVGVDRGSTAAFLILMFLFCFALLCFVFVFVSINECNRSQWFRFLGHKTNLGQKICESGRFSVDSPMSALCRSVSSTAGVRGCRVETHVRVPGRGMIDVWPSSTGK